MSAARNCGIRAARGEYVAFLDSDDLWVPTKIEKQVSLIEQSPRIGVVFCVVRRLDLQSGASQLRPCRSDVRGDIRRKLLHRNCVTGSASAVLVRRECFAAVGLFDETLRSAEDWEMWIRISRQFHFDYVPEPHRDTLWNMLSAPVPLTPELLAGGRIVTDAVNPAAHEFAQTQMIYRKSVVEGIPSEMLLN